MKISVTKEERREYSREYRSNNKERIQQYFKAYYKENKGIKHPKRIKTRRRDDPKIAREYRLRERFNISPEEHDRLIHLQENLCAICKRPERLHIQGRVMALSIDHDRACCNGRKSCGRCIRGLLCSNCNVALGLIEDNIEYLKSAITYLQGEDLRDEKETL